MPLSFDEEVLLKAHYGISHNVAAKMILFLKKVVTNAFNNGSIRANPFANYSIRRTKVDVGYLTKEELAAIRNKKITIRRLEHLRDAFLFCCYTGLSYIDVKKLTKRDLRINDEGEMWISIKRQKTDTAVNVLVLDVARALVEKYDGKLDNDLVLPVPSNQKCNAYLKELADICYIDKKLTFHMSRHTFATTVTLGNGVPIETVSKMLGHSNIKTTQIYARITTDKIQNDMQKLAKVLAANGQC